LLARHDNDWTFDPTESQTAVVFVPFDASSANHNAIRSVEFVSYRKAKIFYTPSGVPTFPSPAALCVFEK
jgi:hypothetical protein